MIVRNATRDKSLGEEIGEASNFLGRLKGLLGVEELVPGAGIWIHPCNSIHSFGMRFEFDALFLDAEGQVVGAYSRYQRNRISRIHRNARGVLELPAGIIEATGTEVGDAIVFEA
ncbi:MAG TPA: DUF192 domain-containing protein [Candidatus Deferrimicrobiaceae bacterium]